MKNNLTGVYDLHVHTNPDVKQRKLDDILYIRECISAGMSGVLLKNHMESTAVRAGLARILYPGFDVYGGVVLNPSVGGLNPAAVEAAAKAGGRVVWFPTLLAKDYIDFKKTEDPAAIDVLDEDGECCSAAAQILETAVRYNLVVATGHLAQKSAAKVAEEAFRRHVKKFWFTHINHPSTVLDDATKLRFRDMGAFFELSYHPIASKMATIEQAAADIRLIGADNIVLSTDLGQPELPDPVEGMSDFIELLAAQGISRKDIEKMTVTNSKMLLAAD